MATFSVPCLRCPFTHSPREYCQGLRFSPVGSNLSPQLWPALTELKTSGPVVCLADKAVPPDSCCHADHCQFHPLRHLLHHLLWPSVVQAATTVRDSTQLVTTLESTPWPEDGTCQAMDVVQLYTSIKQDSFSPAVRGSIMDVMRLASIITTSHSLGCPTINCQAQPRTF